jgi:hypothetical protein
VVARHDELRRRQPPEVRRRVAELPLACPLREVSADNEQRGLALAEIGDQPFGNTTIESAEMKVRDVRDRSHPSIVRATTEQ